ncbi:MAG TPA: ATPase [Cyanobacteria bacterium UBA11369]|nr:ATPase [Cyanobacteria bacterium UBA11371]HBE36554.1 ATPase [Cyanobacteria bacterium UBA11368]HBE47772.1 ATPase [Cyanobacteria bacterium UBA11369]
MPNCEKLRQQLLQLDGRGYKAYQNLQGNYAFGEDFVLWCDRIQGDPFASPSNFRVQVSLKVAGFPRELYRTKSREIALRDYITRQFDSLARRIAQRRGTGNSGLIAIAKIGQEVLERTSVLIADEMLEVRFVVGLPAGGRRIFGQQAVEMLLEDIPHLVDRTLKYDRLDAEAIQRHVETIEDADWMREKLVEKNLVAFIPDGAILPRLSGVDDKPLQDRVVRFQSPESLKVEFNCPHRGLISGMGVPAGVTLIVGGGYHGKSTLLKAIELGVYNHIPDDGREFVVTDAAAVKIRAEDGRSIAGVDISPFINHLPQNRSTTDFSTTNASGSTSQAANIIEALEAGAKVLLVDEDTAATNFMIRDKRMQALIAKEQEPITPFIDKVRQLYADYGVSTILVMGGSGDYFAVADTVIAMHNFQPEDVTEKAKAIALQYTDTRTPEGGENFGKITPRIPQRESIDPSRGQRQVRLKVRDVDEMVFGTEDIDLSSIDQIVDTAQLKAIAQAMLRARQRYIDKRRTIAEILDLVMADIESGGLDILTQFPQCDLAIFRRFELAAAIDRLRSLKIVQPPST